MNMYTFSAFQVHICSLRYICLPCFYMHTCTRCAAACARVMCTSHLFMYIACCCAVTESAATPCRQNKWTWYPACARALFLCLLSAAATTSLKDPRGFPRSAPTSPSRAHVSGTRCFGCVGSPSTRPALECVERSGGSEGGVGLLLPAARGLRLRLIRRACNRA